MTREQALDILSYHSGRNSNIDSPKWRNSFLGMLRPYKGVIYEENFIEIMECLKILRSDINEAMINKEIVANINGIIFYTRMWIEKGGILEGILQDEHKNMIKEWIYIISYSFICLLEGSPEAFYEYENYVEDRRR